MNDATGKPVSMRKTTGEPAGGATTSTARPTTIVALAAAMLLSGVAAIVAALGLYGHHDQLVTTLTKNSYTSDAVVTSAARAAGAELTTALGKLDGSTLTTAQKTTLATGAANALDTAVAKNGHETSAQRDDQKTKVRSAVTKTLDAITGPVTSTDATSAGASLSATVTTNLHALQTTERNDIDDTANKLPKSQLIAGVILLVALSFVAFGAYAGRYWARWGVPVLWVLCSFTGTAAGFYSLLQVGSSLPVVFRFGSALSALALIAAIVFGFLKPSRGWYEAHRPAVPAGRAQRRGLFGGGGGFGARSSGSTASSTAREGSARTSSRSAAGIGTSSAARSDDRAAAVRTKKRAAAEATSRGAELARARAKTASKSRRTER